ncbi:hypothetical protein [Streptomyces sp. NPDC014006]
MSSIEKPIPLMAARALGPRGTVPVAVEAGGGGLNLDDRIAY